MGFGGQHLYNSRLSKLHENVPVCVKILSFKSVKISLEEGRSFVYMPFSI